MREPICLEIGGDGWCTAWAARWPGAHISRPSDREAIAAMPQELAAFFRFLRQAGDVPPRTGRITVEVVERQVFRAHLRHGGTQACFEIDRAPIAGAEMARQLRWLRHSRRLLRALVGSLPLDGLYWGTPGRRGRRPGKGGGGWTIWLYLRHIAGVEKWYLANFWKGLPRLPRSDTVFERLAVTRAQVLEVFRNASAADRVRSVKSSGEIWTMRKVLRRLLYHERYHLRTIARILLASRHPVPPPVRAALGLPALVRPLPGRIVRYPGPIPD